MSRYVADSCKWVQKQRKIRNCRNERAKKSPVYTELDSTQTWDIWTCYDV